MKTTIITRLELLGAVVIFAGAVADARGVGVVTTLTWPLRAPLNGTAGTEILEVDLRAAAFLVAFLADFLATFLAGARFTDFFAADFFAPLFFATLFFATLFLALFFALLFFAATSTPLKVYLLCLKVTPAPPKMA
jgi:hypothetical protein